MQSMTGCGRGQERQGPWEVTVELKAVNHRFLDIACRLPRSLSFLEEIVRSALTARLRRGHVDVFVTVARTDASDRQVQVDEALAAAYRDAAERLAGVLGSAQRLELAQLMAMEGVVTVTESDMDEEAVGTACRRAMDEAIHQLCAMREREGARLREDVLARSRTIRSAVGQVEERSPQTVQERRERMEARIRELLDGVPLEESRLLTEVAIYADKVAVDEETVRLRSHLEQLDALVSGDGAVGR